MIFREIYRLKAALYICSYPPTARTQMANGYDATQSGLFFKIPLSFRAFIAAIASDDDDADEMASNNDPDSSAHR